MYVEFSARPEPKETAPHRGCSLRPLGAALCRTLQAQWTKHNGATLARSLLTPGEGFWINPFGVDNLAASVQNRTDNQVPLSGIIPPRCYQRRIKRRDTSPDWPPRR